MTATLAVDRGLSRLRADWLERNPFKDHVPCNLNPPPRVVSDGIDVDVDRLAALRGEIDAKLNESGDGARTTYRLRREIEERLADYIEQHVAEFAHVRELVEAPAKLRACRRSGLWGERGDAGRAKLVMGWDFKCGLTRLCPDESRAEQRRLVRRYKPAIGDWKREKPCARRVQKAVITWPNIAAGQLAPMKRAMMKQFAKLVKKFPCIQGVLVSQEDPLSERDDWNVHLNVVLLVEGRFDWSEFRAEWTAQTKHLFPECAATSYQMELRELPRCDDRALDDALREVIKYAVKHQDMAGLSPGRFLEWWNAGLRFRRTRSYGVLFRIGDVKAPRAETIWHGRVQWDRRAGAYAVYRAGVGLTQADNSKAKRPVGGLHGPPARMLM